MSLLSELLERAVDIGASDLHVTCGQSPVYRVSGEIAAGNTEQLSEEQVRGIVAAASPEHLRGEFEKNGELDCSLALEDIGRFRVNIFMTRRGPAVVFRHVKSDIPTLEELKLPSSLHDLAKSQRGVLFVTGSTGSGKSSTLAAMLGNINSNLSRRIITLEDPVEYIFTDKRSVISQREIGLDTASFHAGLKRVLRQDPDIIMIGEMRDAESFATALGAAETGHFVMSTLHTASAAQSISRILDFSPETEREQIRKALSDNLVAVLSQRLLPSTKGGRVPAMEIMLNTPTVRKLIYENQLSKLPHAIESDNESGMQTFDQSIYQLIVDGVITEETGLSQATNPQALQMNLKGIFQDGSRGSL